MDINIGGEPDRLINDLYVWIVKDKQTQLEGIFAMKVPGGLQMQCATSSIDSAKKIATYIKSLPYADKEFKLYRYKKADVIETL